MNVLGVIFCAAITVVSYIVGIVTTFWVMRTVAPDLYEEYKKRGKEEGGEQ